MQTGRAIFVVGTTASGKSDVAVEMAEAHKGCIINCDSIQCYQKLAIGSAQPSDEQKSRVPHFLFSFVEPPQEITAGEYRRHHFEILDKVPSPAFVVGGTGFYFQALEKGMFSAPAASEEIQAELEKILEEPLGEERLWKELHEKDPVSAAKIHQRDHYRLVRALEVIRREGRPLSEIRKELEKNPEKYPWPYIKMGIYWEKDELVQRVEERTRKMLEAGLVEEVRECLDQGLGSWAPLSSVGYKECVHMIQENKTKEWLFEEIVRSTLKLAKKQRTWFQRDPEIHWCHGREGLSSFREKVSDFLSRTSP